MNASVRDRPSSSVVIFMKYREAFAGKKGEKEKAYVGQDLNCFNSILLANQDNSLGHPKRLLRVATAVRYSYYVQTVAIKRI